MKTANQYEREIAEKDRMIAMLREQLTMALTAIADGHAKSIKARRAA